jgi:hypothetical protein
MEFILYNKCTHYKWSGFHKCTLKSHEFYSVCLGNCNDFKEREVKNNLQKKSNNGNEKSASK